MPVYDGQITRSDAAPLIPEEVTTEIFQNAQESSVFLRLARRLPNMARGQERMPVLASLPTAYVVGGDTDLRQTSEVDWKNKYIDAAEIAAIVPIPKNVMADSDYPIWEQVMPLMAEAAGAVVDGATFVGTNAASVWPSDLKTGAVAAGHSVSAASFGLSTGYYDAILGGDNQSGGAGLFAHLENQGYMVTGWAAHPVMRGRLRTIKDSTGQPLFMTQMQQKTPYLLDGVSGLFCQNGGFTSSQALMFAGDWNQVVYAFRQEAQWEILREGVINDAAGNIIYNLGQQRMIALLMFFRFGWQVPNPPKRLSPTEATRYPVAVLTN